MANPLAKYMKEDKGSSSKYMETNNPLVKYMKKEAGIPYAVFEPARPTTLKQKAKMGVRKWIEAGRGPKMTFPPFEVARQLLYHQAGERDIPRQAVGEFLNTRAFGLPHRLGEWVGYKRPLPETAPERIATGLGGLAGFIQGPVRTGQRIAPGLPIIGKLFTPAATKIGVVGKSLGRGAAGLGTAEALMTPAEGLIAPGARAKQFVRGAQRGALFSAIGFTPNRPARMAISSGVIGVPSTLRNEPLEDQIFNYGLGAYFGIKKTRLKDVMAQEKEIGERIERGTEGKEASKYLKTNEKMLSDLEIDIRAIGRDPQTKAARFTSILRSGGKYVYTPIIDERKWRATIIKDVWNRMKQIRANPSYVLREDDTSFVINNISTKKSLTQMDNATLYNLNEVLKQDIQPKIKVFETKPVVKRDIERGKHLNLWDSIFRPGYKLLQKLGFGEEFNEGLTRDFFEADRKQAMFLNHHREVVSNWQRIVGFNRDTSRRIFRYLDGKAHERILSPKELSVAKQIRRYLDLQLEYINRHRAQFGEEPIKPRRNYITHIFDAFRQDFINKKYPIPEYIESIMRFITPKEKRDPFLKQRRGAAGYIEDIWKALDAYSYKTSGTVSDQPIRRGEKIVRYIQKEIRLNEKMGKRSPIDWEGIRSNLDSYLKDYVGRPGKLDKSLRGALDVVNRHLPPDLQIRSIGELTNTFNSLVYGATMGYRPKLAIRNLGQHSLIFGEVGAKPLMRAIKTSNVTANRIIQHSKVLDTRKLHFAPEIQPAFSNRMTSRLSRSAFWMYRGADWINVRNAFLAGYYEAKGQGKSDMAAYKRGDQVAAKTQYLYLKGNRSPLARGMGLSPALGRTAGVFTTWPTNWLELQLSWAKPQHREKLLRYIALNVGLLGLGALTGTNYKRYTGIDSWTSIYDLMRLRLPIAGVIERPSIAILRDISKVIKKEDLRELLLYTWDLEKRPLEPVPLPYHMLRTIERIVK